jgi:hypothetical protein
MPTASPSGAKMPPVRLRTPHFDVRRRRHRRGASPIPPSLRRAGSARSTRRRTRATRSAASTGSRRRIACVQAARAEAFVDALPRNYIDPLPALASRIKSKPALVADRDITYAEAEPLARRQGPRRVRETLRHPLA